MLSGIWKKCDLEALVSC